MNPKNIFFCSQCKDENCSKAADQENRCDIGEGDIPNKELLRREREEDGFEEIFHFICLVWC